MELKFASHCSYQIRYHQVYCVKFRKQLLKREECRLYLKKCVWEICQRYWFTVDEIWTDWDHVHVFVWASPKRSPAKIMQVIKSITAKEMFKKFPEIKKELRWWEFWSDWWYVWTVWEWTNEDIVKRYIRNQGDEIEKEQYKQLSLFKIGAE
jgi:putative transposase